MKKRAWRVALFLLGALTLLIAYLLFFRLTGKGLFCPVKRYLKLSCPGCGITHALACLLVLDFKGMLHHNLLSPLIVLYLGGTVLKTALSYIRTGKREEVFLPRWVNLTFLLLLLVFTVTRNIVGI